MSTIECLICGKKFGHLGPHLKSHNITGKEYKKKFGVKVLVSEDVSKLIGSRPYGRPWIYGRTKETEPRLKIMGERISRANKGRLVWNDGLSGDPNSPNYDPRLEKSGKKRSRNHPDIGKEIWKKRKENDPNDEWIQRARETKLRNDPHNLAAKRAAKTRKINDPDGKSYQKTWPTRRERYPPSGYKDYDALCKRMKIMNNDPEKIKLSLEVMLERYGPSLMSNPEQVGKKHSEFMTSLWASKTPEEKAEWLRKTFFSGNKRPNVSESKLIPILEPLGFVYNGNGPVMVNDHIPDFVHKVSPLFIEFDGEGGHRSDLVPYLPKNKEQLDNQRDADYRVTGKYVLRLLPHDLKLGKKHIQNKVKTWMAEYSILEAKK